MSKQGEPQRGVAGSARVSTAAAARREVGQGHVRFECSPRDSSVTAATAPMVPPKSADSVSAASAPACAACSQPRWPGPAGVPLPG